MWYGQLNTEKNINTQIESQMQPIALDIAKEKGFSVHLFEVGEKAHVHCFISAPPKICVSYIVKMIKGILARKIFILYPKLKQYFWKGVLWNHSYYVETIGSISEENIRMYIEKQTNSY